jgi:hypothetical protein
MCLADACNADTVSAARFGHQEAHGSEPETVRVGFALLWKGTFTVHSNHPVKFESGSHQKSMVLGVSDLPVSATVGWPRLQDNIHTFEFVGQSSESYY